MISENILNDIGPLTRIIAMADIPRGVAGAVIVSDDIIIIVCDLDRNSGQGHSFEPQHSSF